MIKICIDSLLQLEIGCDFVAVNKEKFHNVTEVAPISSSNVNALSFIASKNNNKEVLLKDTHAGLVICDLQPELAKNIRNDICVVLVKDPRLFFAKLLGILSKKNLQYFIHPTANIDEDAHVSKNVQIGANVTIGKSTIGEGSIIYPNVTIYDNVIIGKNAVIDSGVVIGAPGFGFARDENGVPVFFPQLGGVVIGDNVEIGANSCVDRGALQDTVICNNVKIDNFTQVSHNDYIGENTMIMCGCVIAGSVTIGKNCWISAAVIMNKKTIGDNVTLGIGSVILNDVKSGETCLGNPATNLNKYTAMQYAIKKLVKK